MKSVEEIKENYQTKGAKEEQTNNRRNNINENTKKDKHISIKHNIREIYQRDKKNKDLNNMSVNSENNKNQELGDYTDNKIDRELNKCQKRKQIIY